MGPGKSHHGALSSSARGHLRKRPNLQKGGGGGGGGTCGSCSSCSAAKLSCRAPSCLRSARFTAACGQCGGGRSQSGRGGKDVHVESELLVAA